MPNPNELAEEIKGIIKRDIELTEIPYTHGDMELDGDSLNKTTAAIIALLKEKGLID